jgi:hypothetical protein
VRCRGAPGKWGKKMFGFTEAQISEFGVTYGLGGMMAYMLFIIGELAYSSKAGKVGTFALFFVLAFGIFGFIAKNIIEKLWGI